MANISKGLTFSSGDLVTAVKLNDLVDDASISDITEGAFAAGSHIITSSTTAPAGATAGHAWWDTTAAEAEGYGILKIHDGNRWQSVAKNVEQYYTNKSGGVLTYGDLVVFDTSGDPADAQAVTTTTSAGNTLVAGVVASGTDGSGTVADNAEGRVVRCGLVVVTTNGSVDRGHYLGASATAKEAYSLGSSPTVGAFGVAVKNTATNKWLVAMSGHTVDYIQKTTTEVLLQQNSTVGTCDNNNATSGGTIPGTSWGPGYASADDGVEPAADTLHPLTWYDATLTGEEDVVVEGTVTAVANQLIHVELKDFALATVSSSSTTGLACNSGLAVVISDNSSGAVKSIKHWHGMHTHTQESTQTGSDIGASVFMPGMSTYVITSQTIGGISAKDAIWWKSLEHSFTADADGTYKVKVYWFVGTAGRNWCILNPSTTLTSGTMGDLGMGKPTLKVVTR